MKIEMFCAGLMTAVALLYGADAVLSVNPPVGTKLQLGTTTNSHTLILTDDVTDTLFTLRLTTNVVTEWLSIPVTTNDLRHLNGETYVEVRQIGMLVTNRTLYVEHDGLTNEQVLKVLGKGEYPAEPLIKRKIMQKVNKQ